MYYYLKPFHIVYQGQSMIEFDINTGYKVYGREIPIEGEVDRDMEPHDTDVDKSTADDDAVKELDEMEKRLKEMEEEAGGALREMQAKVEKEMGVVQNPASDAASFSGKQGGS
nr:polyadenylate-binding protein 2 [Ipomoea batatas]